MPRGTRQEGRVALVDFYWPDRQLHGWRDGHVYALGLYDNQFGPMQEGASPAVKEARSYFFSGYQGSPYPHILSLRPEPLMMLLRSVLVAKGMKDDFESLQQYDRYIRITGAKISDELHRAVLTSGDSRKIWCSIDPYDVDWESMHYDERLLCWEAYRSITEQDPHAFLRAIGARVPAKTAT